MLFTLFVTVLAVPTAQGQAQSDSASAAPTVATSDSARVGAGPRVEAARVGIAQNASASAQVSTATPVPLVQGNQSNNSGRTLMLVGGLVFMGGLLIGDNVGTAIAVTGLAFGAYGFYQLIR
jgi:hypothetical protein